MKCARHPVADTLLTCVTCGTPICPDCMVETPVGMKCPVCGLTPLPAVYRIEPARLAMAIVAGAVLGGIAGVLALAIRPGFGLFALLLAPVAGSLGGDVVSRAAGGKRGRTLATAGAAAVAVGLVLLAPQVVAIVVTGAPAAWSDVLRVVARRPTFLLYSILTLGMVFWRVR
jgi:hypothetical protein